MFIFHFATTRRVMNTTVLASSAVIQFNNASFTSPPFWITHDGANSTLVVASRTAYYDPSLAGALLTPIAYDDVLTWLNNMQIVAGQLQAYTEGGVLWALVNGGDCNDIVTTLNSATHSNAQFVFQTIVGVSWNSFKNQAASFAEGVQSIATWTFFNNVLEAFNGQLDDIMYYDRMLTQGDVIGSITQPLVQCGVGNTE